MSMLGASDNEQHSYIELVYALTQYGAEPTKDMEELWRRIVLYYYDFQYGRPLKKSWLHL